MTYQETIDWMFSQLPMYQQKGIKALNNKLDNTIGFAKHLNNPHKQFKSIHVAGTNGKGSSSHMIASILQEAGYKVGLYTSPHIKDFRERIKINGTPVSKQFVIGFIKKHKPFLESQTLSFFEMTVGMAFAYFAQKKVDIAVIEVGLGGRLDSTNIITPEVSLITNIGLDHTAILGDTLSKIAREKAGIIKPHVPVVISEYHTETLPVFKEVALKNNAELIEAFTIKCNYKTDLLGKYQQKNIKGVVATINQLKKFIIKQEHIVDGLQNVVKNTGLLGRWQILNNCPLIVCDTAHNVDGITEVLNQIYSHSFTKLHMVLGFVNDKNVDQILNLLPKDAKYYFCKPNVPRGLNQELLAKKANNFGLVGRVYKTVSDAYKDALEKATPTDFIFIGGSTFVVAEIV